MLRSFVVESIKPAKPLRHLETKHQELCEKSQSFFKIKASQLEQSKKTIIKIATGANNETEVLASYQVSLLVAKSGKPYTIAEELLLPSAKIMVFAMLREKTLKELNVISLFHSTVKNIIVDISENVKEQLILNIKTRRFYALQLDKSSDIRNYANLFAFVCYECNDGINENFLFYKPLPLHTTGEVLDDFMSTHEITWDKCVTVSMDGARAMIGTGTELSWRMKQINPSIIWHQINPSIFTFIEKH
ncbi:zinc finger BED domain-containing protein 5-like [Diabrotica undecimpunctata]|uniref:zinc finger BED domain-containing protein 5-like n=1 Tax=Diabrotica undecimpunctata TaxID=50387 RepID=UPI003B640977